MALTTGPTHRSSPLSTRNTSGGRATSFNEESACQSSQHHGLSSSLLRREDTQVVLWVVSEIGIRLGKMRQVIEAASRSVPA